MNACRHLASCAAAIMAAVGSAAAQLTPDWTSTFSTAPDAVGDEAVDIVADAAGNVYVTGSNHTWFEPGLSDIVTIRYAPDGTQDWVAVYDGPAMHDDFGRAIAIDAAGDLVVAGRSAADFVVLKYDTADGSLIWESLHDAGGTDQPNAMTTDPQGNIYVTGQSWATEQNDYYTLKMDPSGTVLWTERYSGPGAFLFAHDVAYDVVVDAAGDVFVTGSSNSPGSGSGDFFTIKYRGSDGQVLWSDRYSVGPNESGNEMAIDAGGDVFVTGTSFQDTFRFVTIRYRGSDGARLWIATDSPQVCNIATDVALDGEGGVYVTGTSDPDCNEGNFNENIATIKYSAADGALLWSDVYGSDAVGTFDVPYDLALDQAGNVFVTGENTGLFILLDYHRSNGVLLQTSTIDPGPNEIATGTALTVEADDGIAVTGFARNVNTENRDYLTLRFPSQEAPLPGDLDGDGHVGINDFLMLLAAWGPCPGPCPPSCPADLDGDCDVGIADFLTLLANWS